MTDLLNTYKKLSVTLFGRFAEKHIDTFKPLKTYLMGANIKILLKTWACLIFLTSIISFLVSFLIISLLILFFNISLYYLIFAPILLASLSFLIFYVYPIQRANSIKRSIENDLPFALAHMNAIASSGIPPEFMFELLTNFEEYGAIANEANLIVRNIKTFGMSSTNAINNVAQRTISSSFRQVLNGIVSTIEKGGNLIAYLEEMSEQALFNYRIKREKYLKTLSTYADIYTALLVAAPLIMLSILGVMNIIGGSIMGLSIQEIIWLITWVILPLLNICFLVFIHVTYPGI